MIGATIFPFYKIHGSSQNFVKYLTNRFHVAVRLFSNRSQMTSKCGKNKKVAHEAQWSVSLIIKNQNIFGKKPFYFKFRHFDRHKNNTLT